MCFSYHGKPYLGFDNLIDHSAVNADENDAGVSLLDDERPGILAHMNAGRNLVGYSIAHLRIQWTR